MVSEFSCNTPQGQSSLPTAHRILEIMGEELRSPSVTLAAITVIHDTPGDVHEQ
jgi:hypothetical protein